MPQLNRNVVFQQPDPYYAMRVEVLLTYFPVNAIFFAAIDGKDGQFTGLVIKFSTPMIPGSICEI
jgi:hypothetical protein